MTETMSNLSPFDQVINRRGTSSIKWDRYVDRDVLPMWVADMDFQSPPSVRAALRERVDHGVFGYTAAPASLVEAVTTYARQNYGWAIDPEWLIWLPGLVLGLNLACRAVGRPGDAVVTATPIYPPFLSAPGLADRKLIAVPLAESSGRWLWDFGRLESSLTAETRLLMLCHPHNPVGRAWHKDELRALIDLARRRDLIICSDEIHADLILEPGRNHCPLAAVDPDFAARTITLMAPSKTWNLPGLGCAFAVIPDPSLRQRYTRAMTGLVPHVNLMGYVAAEAAYRDDGRWHAGLIEYLRSNRQLLVDWFAASERLHMNEPEATYLAWIDARAVDPVNPLPVFESLGVGLSDGRDFGLAGYLRLNFGCQRSLLEEALQRLLPLR